MIRLLLYIAAGCCVAAAFVTSFLEGGTVPVATVDLQGRDEIELKSLPGGKVTLQRLSYGQKLYRQELAMKLQLSGTGRRDSQGEVKMLAQKSTAFDFAHCIVDHNLTDVNGQPLDFKKEFDVQRLDPRVGEEIAALIDKLNNFEEEDQANPEGNS